MKKKKNKNVLDGDYRINKKDKKEVELYVLWYMFVTAATFHVDRLPLNTEADWNAVRANKVVDVNKKENIKIVRGWYYWINRKTRKRWNCTYFHTGS